MKNKINVILIVLCVAFPLIVGYISSLITSNAMAAFNSMNKPPLAPPGWLFPIVWSVLYVLMGLASYLIITSASSFKALALIIYIQPDCNVLSLTTSNMEYFCSLSESNDSQDELR